MGCSYSDTSKVSNPYEVSASNAYNKKWTINEQKYNDSTIAPGTLYVPTAALPVKKYDNFSIKTKDRVNLI